MKRFLDIAIDTSGQFPAKETKLFAGFGKEIRKRFDRNIAETKGSGKELILKLSSHPVRMNTISIMEDITKGENIRKYSVEVWINIINGDLFAKAFLLVIKEFKHLIALIQKNCGLEFWNRISRL